MNEPFEQSVTGWIQDLKQGNDDAAAMLWNRYFNRMVSVARNKLGSMPRRVLDEEDIAINVFDSLCRGASEGRFEQLQSREDLWALIVAITSMKAVDEIRRHNTQKRGGGQVRGDSIVMNINPDGNAGFEQFMAEDPTPEFLAMVDEEQKALFDKLTDDTQKKIAVFRLEGYSNEEIAEKLSISVRSVERKLNLIRQNWSRELEEEDDE